MTNAINEAQKLLHAEMEKTLYSFPMWMRFNYLLNTISNALDQGNKTEDINWDKVNEILTTNRNEYDFNFFKRIESVDALMLARADCMVAPMNIDGCSIWQSHTCKDCGKPFMMSYKEVKFYENKQLHIPKRCKSCRDKRKVGSNK
jgi:hypothetical protein